mgnify:FL=1|jgi:hypothetical protein
MKQVKFRIESDKRKDSKYIKGYIIKEYKDFYLIETNSGYRECISKAQLITGEIERVK